MIHFVAGTPRSGSSLFQNIIASNPALHATATNELSSLVSSVRDQWTTLEGFKAQGLSAVEPRIRNALAGLMRGFYAGELLSGRTVFDKSRLWPSLIEVVEAALGRQVRVVVTVRDIREVVASLEKVYRRSVLTRGATLRSLEDRVATWTDGGNLIGSAVLQVVDAFDRGLADRLIIVPYDALTKNPRAVMADLHDLLELEPFDYEPENVEQRVTENDDVYGLDLHRVRPQVRYQPPTWHEVLTPAIADSLAKRFEDVNILAELPGATPGHMVARKVP